MRLLPEDAGLFFKLMNALQFFVKEKLKLLPEIKSFDEFKTQGAETRIKVRDALFAQPTLIDEFIRQNPAQLTPSELDIVAGWKEFVKGDFFLERFLKKYSIWIGEGSPAKVYGVLSLFDDLEDIIHPSYLPMRIHGVLLPFNGQIVYDGLFQSYKILFGGGIKASLREEYMAAKQNGRIIESLTNAKGQQQPTRAVVIKDWSREVEELVQLVEGFKARNVPIQNEVFGLLKSVTALTQLATESSTETSAMWNQFDKVFKALNKVETALHRAER